jgi:hypothetical protein
MRLTITAALLLPQFGRCCRCRLGALPLPLLLKILRVSPHFGGGSPTLSKALLASSLPHLLV